MLCGEMKENTIKLSVCWSVDFNIVAQHANSCTLRHQLTFNIWNKVNCSQNYFESECKYCHVLHVWKFKGPLQCKHVSLLNSVQGLDIEYLCVPVQYIITVQSHLIYGCQSNSAILHHGPRDSPPSHSKHIVACHLPRGSKLRSREGMYSLQPSRLEASANARSLRVWEPSTHVLTPP